MPPHQRAQRSQAHHTPDEHRQPRIRYVDKHDLHRSALLVVVRGHGRLVETDQQQDGGCARQPWQNPRGQRQEPGRVGEIDQRHGTLLMVVAVRGNQHECAPRELIEVNFSEDQSSPCRRLAAAANGPMTKLISDSAHRIENGAPNDNPDIAACEAATPKISTGIDRGSTSTASNSPPRCSVTAKAAPIMPVKVSAGVPANSVKATADVESASRFKRSPSTGVAITSGSPAASQCASALAAQASSSGVRPITIRSSEPSSWSAMNSRSSVSRLASSAPSQRTAGPSRVSSARSGPTANGISTTTVRKNNTPISAPPPTRSAIWMSLRIRAARAVMPGNGAPPARGEGTESAGARGMR